MKLILEAIITGVLTGGVALMASGLTLVYGVMEIVNIAQEFLWSWAHTSVTRYSSICTWTSSSACL